MSGIPTRDLCDYVNRPSRTDRHADIGVKLLSHATKVTLTVSVVGGDPHVHCGLLHGTAAPTSRPARSDQADE
jgi:hypothetical protein